MNSSLKVGLKQVGWSLMLAVAIVFTTTLSLTTSFLSWAGNWFGTLKTLSGKKLEELGKSAD